MDSVSPNKPLFAYLETYLQQKAKRDEAKQIQSEYPLGFSAIFGNKNIETCNISDICNIISSRARIKSKHDELERIEREQLETERKRQEEIRKQQEIRGLKSCVSSWPQPRRSSLEYFSLYNYYPKTCDWDASESEWDIRKLIWDFKAKPHNYQSTEEIMWRHRNSVDIVLPKLCKVLRHYFGNKVPKLTIVPVLASTRIVSDRRYADILERICNKLNMYNGYLHVTCARCRSPNRYRHCCRCCSCACSCVVSCR